MIRSNINNNNNNNNNNNGDDEEDEEYLKLISNVDRVTPTVKQYYNILKGKYQLDNLPRISPRTIRLYLCAPYEDTIDEVNELTRNVIPKLREFATYRYGIEFQVIDLHWGVHKSQISNRNLLQECLTEIQKCNSQSVGMTFLCLISEQYGQSLLPLWFDRVEFEAVLSCLANENSRAVNKLKHFYKLNINNLTNRYELENEKDLTEEIEKDLINLLNVGLRIAIKNDLLDESLLIRTNQSILQKLMNYGAFQTENKENKVFSYIKLFNSSSSSAKNNNNNNNNNSSNVNVMNLLKLDDRLETLLNKEINYYLPVEQIYRIKLDKQNRDHRTYLNNFGQHYRRLFENLIDKFIQKNPERVYHSLSSSSTSNLIIGRQSIQNHYYNMALNDTLYNLNFIKENKLNDNLEFNLNGEYREIIRNIMNYIYEEEPTSVGHELSSSGATESPMSSSYSMSMSQNYAQAGGERNKPLILYGQSGTGKTSHMATLASSLYFQLNLARSKTLKDQFILIRFVGVDGKTTNLRDLLKSLCAHLNVLFKMKTEVPTRLNELKAYFKRFLTGLDHSNCQESNGQASSSPNQFRNLAVDKKLVIILDSLQDLNDHDNAFKLDWLPVYLRKNCKLILTISSESKILLNKLKIKYNFASENDHQQQQQTATKQASTSLFIKLDNYLSKENGEFLIRRLLQLKNYRLQDDQFKQLFDLLDMNQNNANSNNTNSSTTNTNNSNAAYMNSRSSIQRSSISSSLPMPTSLLLSRNRQQQQQQQQQQKHSRNHHSYILIRLLCNELCKLKSYSNLIEDDYFKRLLNNNINNGGHFEINTFLNNYLACLESKFDAVLTKHLLGYITISQNGFSELELQDLLSLDNILLTYMKSNEVYLADNKQQQQQQHPFIRYPWLYILRIINYLGDLLIYRPFQGVSTLHWRHRIFFKVVRGRYLDQDAAFRSYLHRNVAEYLMGVWSNNRPKRLDYEITKVPAKNSSSANDASLVFDKPVITRYSLNADRLIPMQPIKYEDFHTNIRPRYNLRKLCLLPFHLIEANMIKELFDLIYFNLDWLHSKILAFDLAYLIYDFEMYTSNYEANLVCECLKMAESAINQDTNLLFIELSGRLLPYYKHYENIHKLVDQCDRMAFKLNPLVPINQISSAPSWLIQQIVNMNIDIENSSSNLQLDLLEGNHNGNLLIMKQFNSLNSRFYDLDLCEHLNDVFTGKGMVYCSKNGEYICTIEVNNAYKFIIRRIETGELHGSIELDKEYFRRLHEQQQHTNVLNFSLTIANVYLSAKYALIILCKASSPIIVDLSLARIVKILPYKPSFCCISPDEQILIIYCENQLHYYELTNFSRQFSLELPDDLPDSVLFTNDNKQLIILTKHRKLVISFKLNLEKKIYKKTLIFQQDFDLSEIKFAYNINDHNNKKKEKTRASLSAASKKQRSSLRNNGGGNYLLASSHNSIYVFESLIGTDDPNSLSSSSNFSSSSLESEQQFIREEFKLLYKIDSSILDGHLVELNSRSPTAFENAEQNNLLKRGSSALNNNCNFNSSSKHFLSLKLALGKNRFTGFGVLNLATTNSSSASNSRQFIFATLDKYLIIYDLANGKKMRIFQSSHLNDTSIIKTYSSSKLSGTAASPSPQSEMKAAAKESSESESECFVQAENENKLISLLDNGKILIWNLNNLNLGLDYNENMNIYNQHLSECLLAKLDFRSNLNLSNFVAYSNKSPFIKLVNIDKHLSYFVDCFSNESSAASTTPANRALSQAKATYLNDNLNTCELQSVFMDETSRYCFVVYDIEDFKDKQMPNEANFIKKLCLLIDLEHEKGTKAKTTDDENKVNENYFREEFTFKQQKWPIIPDRMLNVNNCSIIENFSFIVNRYSRFELNAEFIQKPDSSGTYLLVRSTFCLNDLDPFADPSRMNWTDFETEVKLYGPIVDDRSSPIKLVNEFKLFGESLLNKNENRVAKTADKHQPIYYVDLMHECQKLYEKENGIATDKVKATRYDVHLNIIDLFSSKPSNSTSSINSQTKQQAHRLIGLKELLSAEDLTSELANPIFIDLKIVNKGRQLLLTYSREGARNPDMLKAMMSAQQSAANPLMITKLLMNYEYDYTRFCFVRDINTNKSALVYDLHESKVIRKFSKMFQLNSNVEQLINSNDLYIMDNLWHVYELNRGQLVHKIKNFDPLLEKYPNEMINRNATMNRHYSPKFTQFLFDGSYLLTTSNDFRKVFLVRCNDSHVVASFKLDESNPTDQISSLNVGEADRTILVGTRNGNFLILKLIIDLEHDEAHREYIEHYRSKLLINAADSAASSKSLLENDYKKLFELNLQKEMLNGNLNRFKSFNIYQSRPPSTAAAASAAPKPSLDDGNSSAKSRPKTTGHLLESRKSHQSLLTPPPQQLLSSASSSSSSSSSPLTTYYGTTNESVTALTPTTLNNTGGADISFKYETMNLLNSPSGKANTASSNYNRMKLLHLSQGIKYAHLNDRFANKNGHYQTRACVIQ